MISKTLIASEAISSRTHNPGCKVFNVDNLPLNAGGNDYDMKFNTGLENFPDWERLPEGWGGFDFVLVSDSILKSHLLGWHLRELCRVTREGGIMISITDNKIPWPLSLAYNLADTQYNAEDIKTHARLNGWRYIGQEFNGVAPRWMHLFNRGNRMAPVRTMTFIKPGQDNVKTGHERGYPFQPEAMAE